MAGRFERTIGSTWKFLHDFYLRKIEMNPNDFVVLAKHNSPRLIIDESSDHAAAFVSIEFPEQLKSSVEKKKEIAPQDLSIICEETSHFFHFVHAAEHEYPISVFELETRAEIDRFLCFLHWNDLFPDCRLSCQYENCSDLCETLFENRTFRTSDEDFYREAESLAFHHIRNAFSHCWTNRWINTAQFDPLARRYILKVVGTTTYQQLTA
jgi:hypothetical protein